jgi:hypothetical protein
MTQSGLWHSPHWPNGSHRGHANWVRRILGPVVEHRNPLTRGKHEFWDIDRVGKRVFAQWLVSVMITVWTNRYLPNSIYEHTALDFSGDARLK